MLFACKKKYAIHSSFYLWKQNASLHSTEKKVLEDLAVHDLYIKYFDVDFVNGNANPVAIVDIDSSIFTLNNHIIPVVYITQNALDKCANIITLSQHISQLVNSINTRNKIEVTQVQIDCDWTASNQKKYFELLRNLQKEFSDKIEITATIRLHQIKYPDKTGVPPIKKGMLMFYNMGDLKNSNSLNSIYNKADAMKYVKYCKKYPLKLDIALPIFSWAIHYRNNEVIGLYARKNTIDFSIDSLFQKIDETHYLTTQSCIYQGNYFLKDDLIKVETISPSLTDEAASLLSNYVPLEERNIVFFDLDTTILKSYNHEEFNKILEHFR